MAQPITFAEWGYLGKGKISAPRLPLDTLTQLSSFGEDTLFADLGKHEIFTPYTRTTPLCLSRTSPRDCVTC